MLTREHREKIKYLNQYKYLNLEINRMLETKEELESKVTRVTTTLSHEPKGQGDPDPMATGVAKIADLNKEIDKKIDRYVDLRREIEGKIDKIEDPRYKEILKSRYLDGKRWQEIANKSYYTWKWCHVLHERALDQLKI